MGTQVLNRAFYKLVILDPVGASWAAIGAGWLPGWYDGKKCVHKKSVQENGLHFC